MLCVPRRARMDDHDEEACEVPQEADAEARREAAAAAAATTSIRAATGVQRGRTS